jgi:hypothetical protein
MLPRRQKAERILKAVATVGPHRERKSPLHWRRVELILDLVELHMRQPRAGSSPSGPQSPDQETRSWRGSGRSEALVGPPRSRHTPAPPRKRPAAGRAREMTKPIHEALAT